MRCANEHRRLGCDAYNAPYRSRSAPIPLQKTTFVARSINSTSVAYTCAKRSMSLLLYASSCSCAHQSGVRSVFDVEFTVQIYVPCRPQNPHYLDAATDSSICERVD